jgi:16S rRNA G966 N2-methylase RsmD
MKDDAIIVRPDDALETAEIQEEWYEALIEDLRAIVVESVFRSRWATIEGKHQFGERILEENDNFTRKKIYAKKIVRLIGLSLRVHPQRIWETIQFAKKYRLDDADTDDLRGVKLTGHPREVLPEGKNLSWFKITHKYLPAAERQEQLDAIVVKPSERWIAEIGDIKAYQTDRRFDFIITDPPYPREYLSLYSVLARRAKEWLAPGGLLLAMCGQSYLDEVYALLSKELRYYWTACYLTPGQPTPIQARQVNTSWKPILIYGLDEKYKGKTFGDVFKSEGADKSLHIWGQSESGMLSMIQQVCLPGQSIFDPFMGSGTTGVAALKHGCIFHGIDKDEKCVETSRKRLTEEAAHDAPEE